MSKVFKVLLFLAFLWGLSYFIANFALGVDVSGSIGAGDKVAVIPVNGMITLNGGGSLFMSATSGEEIVNNIEQAESDSSIKGIVLEINSPGGTVMGSKRVADKIGSVEKPVVAVITESGTSGAYWIASQADYIIADELSIVGSIGVLGSYLEFSGLLDDYNVSYQRLVSGQHKDISSPYKEMSDEEEALIQERLDTIHSFFIAEVANGRNMTFEEVSDLSTGLFYLGLEAKELGLIDELGDSDYAIAYAKEVSGITNGGVSEYNEEDTLFDKLKGYMAYSSFYIGQGIGSVLVSSDSGWEIRV
ncbi:signal peptide peptidase SppA [archaeon]|nr:signal peptide peptidase SppA [archaeon]MBT4416896.1 signal peptide peptidase SppA [archaeon]